MVLDYFCICVIKWPELFYLFDFQIRIGDGKDGKGGNELEKILEKVRNELRQEQSSN